METLAIDDIQKLHQGIQQLYTLHDLDTFGLDALSIMHQLIPSDRPLFHLTSDQTCQLQLIFLPNCSSFTKRDCTILNLLRPHLFQAYANAQSYQQLQQNFSQLQQSLHHLGLVILDTEGQVQSIAAPAHTWLETYFSRPAGSRHLPDHLWSWVKHQITGFTKNSNQPPACLPLRIQQAGRELTIRLVVEQLGTRYLLLFEEQTLSSWQSLALLGLSQRETEVLSWVIQGKDNKAIATQLSVHISTVRKHLENIYRKLEVQSRTAAIARSLEKLGVLNVT